MASLGEFDRYKAVLEESFRFSGCFMWKKVPAEWVAANLEHSQKAIERLIDEHHDEIQQRQSVAQNTVRFTSFITALSCLLMVWRSLSKQSLSREIPPAIKI